MAHTGALMSGEATSPEIKATGPAGGGTGGAGAGAGGTAAGASGAAAAAGSTYRRDRHAALRVDVHTHILPETWPDLKARYGYGGFIYLDHHKPHWYGMALLRAFCARFSHAMSALATARR